MPLLRELHRVSRPRAVDLLDLRPDTLRELRDAWASVDAAPHVNPFVDMHDLGSALARAGFSEPVLDVDRHRLDYDEPLALMRELQQIGARNALADRPRGLTGRRRLAAPAAGLSCAARHRRRPGARATWK